MFMKKCLAFLATALLVLVVIVSGCSGSQPKARPSVRGLNPNCVSSSSLIVKALNSDPERTKKDLDGKVVEIYGSVWVILAPERYDITRIDFSGQVMSEIRDITDPKFKTVRGEGDGVVIRGYAEVVYDDFEERYALFLHEAEVIEKFKDYFYKNSPDYLHYLNTKKHADYSDTNRTVF